MSHDWWYVPSLAPQLVQAGGFTLTATQESTSATARVAVRPAGHAPASYWLLAPGLRRPTVLVEGYRAGDRIPIGLYEPVGPPVPPTDAPPLRWRLLEQVAVVTMPPTLVVAVPVPAETLARAATGRFSLTAPQLGDIGVPPQLFDGAPL